MQCLKKTSENHQLIGSDTKIFSLLAWNYSPARDAEIGVPEYTSEALGIAEEAVGLLVHSVKSARNTAPRRLGYLQDEEDRQGITAWIGGEAHQRYGTRMYTYDRTERHAVTDCWHTGQLLGRFYLPGK